MVPPPRGNQNTKGDLGYLPDGHVRHSSELQAPPLLLPHPGPPGNGSGCPVNQLDRGLKPKSDMFHPNPQIYRLHARRLLDKLALLKPSVTSWPTLPGINQPSRTSPHCGTYLWRCRQSLPSKPCTQSTSKSLPGRQSSFLVWPLANAVVSSTLLPTELYITI